MKLLPAPIRRSWPLALAPPFLVWAALIQPPYLAGSALLARGLMGLSAVALVCVALHPTRTVRAAATILVGYSLLARAAALLAVPSAYPWQTRLTGATVWATVAVALTLLLQDRR